MALLDNPDQPRHEPYFVTRPVAVHVNYYFSYPNAAAGAPARAEPTSSAAGLTPGSLRPGGAIWLYQETDNTELVRFRGRWLSSRMLEIYIQEIAGTALWSRLTPAAQFRITHLAAYFDALVQ